MNNANTLSFYIHYYTFIRIFIFFPPDIGRLAQSVKVRQRFVLFCCCFIPFSTPYIQDLVFDFFLVSHNFF